MGSAGRMPKSMLDKKRVNTNARAIPIAMPTCGRPLSFDFYHRYRKEALIQITLQEARFDRTHGLSGLLGPFPRRRNFLQPCSSASNRRRLPVSRGFVSCLYNSTCIRERQFV